MPNPPFGMSLATPVYQNDAPSDTLPTDDMQAPNIDEEDLKTCLINDFQNDCKDKEEWNWVEKQEYNLRAYYMIKDLAMTQRPWPGASAYPVPITPTLLDTGHANIKASMKSGDGKMTHVVGIGEEDIRSASTLESLLNWQIVNDIKMDKIQDKNVFRTLLNGTGIMKVIQDFRNNSVKVTSVDIENFYIPIDANGCQFDDNNGRCTQIIPLSYNDVQFRKLWGIYKDIDKMVPGARVSRNNAMERTTFITDQISGTNKDTKMRRETYFLAETYSEYFSKSGTGYGSNGSPSRAGVRPIYLRISWSPNGGTIHRIVDISNDKIVPFSKYDLYPIPGYFFSMSMPEKLRAVQEKANYSDKQNTDALDKSISPAMFVDDTDQFNTAVSQRVQGGIYPKGKGNTIDFEPQPARDRGFEDQYRQMWIEARELTGLIDINVGAQTNDKTLGQTKIRSYRADIRFADILDRFEVGWHDTMDLIYHYDNKFMPRDTKIKVIGYSNYMSIDELFPNADTNLGLGLEGRYNFEFAGSPVTELEKERQDKKDFYGQLILSPAVLQDKGTYWKAMEQLAKAHDIRDFETVFTKPKEALVLSAQEAIQRIVSGQLQVDIRPGIDTDSYLFEIQKFTRSDTFKVLPPEGQMALMKMYQIADMMRQAQMQAMLDLQTVQQSAFAQNQPIVPAMPGNGKSTGNPGKSGAILQ